MLLPSRFESSQICSDRPVLLWPPMLTALRDGGRTPVNSCLQQPPRVVWLGRQSLRLRGRYQRQHDHHRVRLRPCMPTWDGGHVRRRLWKGPLSEGHRKTVQRRPVVDNILEVHDLA